MSPVALLMLALVLAVAGCTTTRHTSPSRTATEQLLISTAADRAARDVALKMPTGARVYVDASYFEGVDGRYAIGVLRAELLKQGVRLMDQRSEADVIVELRAGALSIDEEKSLLGIPEVPIPFAGDLALPEIALFKRDTQRGVAKFAAIAYDAVDGRLIAMSEPQFGYAHETDWIVLLFFAWTTSDAIPAGEEDEADLEVIPRSWRRQPGKQN